MIKWVLRKSPLLLYLYLYLVFYPFNAYADGIGSVKIDYATGERSQTDEIEERDLSGNYDFYKYGVTVRAKPKKEIYYRIGFKDYKKNFDTPRNNLDNRTNIYNAYISFPLHKTDKSKFGFNADYKLRTKRYKDSPSLEYDENSLSGGFDIDFDKSYSLNLSGGIKDYDYIKNSASNQLKGFFKVAPSIKSQDEAVTVSGYYKRGWVDQSQDKKDYTEDSVSASTILKLNTNFFHKLKGHFGYGRNDTRETEEDREDNLRFEYRLWDITSYHRLDKILDTQFSYGQKQREYFTTINSYDNWFIRNKTKLNLIKKEQFKLELLLAGEHKETKFYVNESLSYNKNSLSGGFNILERANWSFKPTLKFSRYDYPPDSTSDQKSYKLRLDFKKYIGSTDNALEVAYWYKWKDYRYKPDVEQWSLNLSFELKF